MIDPEKEKLNFFFSQHLATVEHYRPRTHANLPTHLQYEGVTPLGPLLVTFSLILSDSSDQDGSSQSQGMFSCAFYHRCKNQVGIAEGIILK